MKTMRFFTIMALVLGVFMASCTGEDGMDGLDGINGVDGAVGPQGPQGEPGQDGTDGQDGEDGNANVSNMSFDISTLNSSFYDQNIPELTAEVIKQDVVIGYVSTLTSSGTERWFALPVIGDSSSFQLDFNIAASISTGLYSIDFTNRADGTSFTITAGDLNELRVVIIDSSSKSSKSDILSELISAGIDINNYQQVADYFSLN